MVMQIKPIVVVVVERRGPDSPDPPPGSATLKVSENRAEWTLNYFIL